MKHNLKIWASFADCVLDGTKTFEVRENDRGFQKGDTIVFEVMDDGGTLRNTFHELNGKEYTITYVLSGWGIEAGKVAKKMGTSQASISAYENGKKDPTYRTLRRLAEVLECTVVDLVK